MSEKVGKDEDADYKRNFYIQKGLDQSMFFSISSWHITSDHI